MSDGSFPLQPLINGQFLTGDRTGIQRAGQASVGMSIATLWRRMLIGVLLLDLPLQIDTFLFHDLEEARFGAISGFNISLTTICLFFLYLQWLPGQIVASQPIQFSRALLAYLTIVGISILWATDRNRVLFELFVLIQASLIFVYVVNNTGTRSDLFFAMTILAIGLIIEAAAMIGVRLIGHEISLGPIALSISELDNRVAGSFGSPNVAASYIAALLAPCLSLFFVPCSGRLKCLAVMAIFLGSIALVLTMSRGGWMAAAFSMAAVCFIAFHKGWMSGRVFAVLVILAGLLVAGCLPILANRLFGDDGGSAVSRVPLNDISRIMIAENPMGVGANNWDIIGQRFAERVDYREEWFYTVHNKYMLVCSELGWLGLMAFLAFMGSILVCGWRSCYQNPGPMSPLAVGFAAALTGQMVHMAFDIFNSRGQVQLICLMAALVVASANLSNLYDNQAESIELTPHPGNVSPGLES